MHYQLILEFVNLFFAGTLAGIEISAHYGFHAPTVALDEKPTPPASRSRAEIALACAHFLSADGIVWHCGNRS